MSDNLSKEFSNDFDKKNGFDSWLNDLYENIKYGKFRIAIYGLGHVGAPIASAWLRSGASIIGVDKSDYVRKNALKGFTHLPEPGVSESFSKGLALNKFLVYDDPIQASKDSSIKMICVPVLVDNNNVADLSIVKDVSISIARGLKKNDVVSLNPSVPPGTTEEEIIPLIEKESGLKVEKDFFMIYNPERIYEGRAIDDIENRYPGIISGAGQYSLKIGSKIFSLIYKKGIIKLDSIKSAETEKLFEGVYRDVNIALANELSIFCENLGIDFWQIRDAANSQPFCHIHKPGIGVGGACIPIYPQFILQVARKNNLNCQLTSKGRLINNSMPSYCVNQALKLVNNKKIDSLVITVLGLAFRGNVSDARLSPCYDVIGALNNLNVKKINVHDPLINSDNYLSKFNNVTLTSDIEKSIQNSDLIIIVTDHKEYKKLTKKELGHIPVYDGRFILEQSNFVDISTIGIGKKL
ncbi:MAG: nucleotide sugar dehydrogenase [Nitrososphaeraceae archaeon]